MRIAFIVGGFPKLSETFILNQITGLIDRRHEVDIYADSPTNEPKVHPDVEKYNLVARTHYIGMPSNQPLRILNGARLLLANFHKDPIVILRTWNAFKYDKQAAFSKLLLPHMVIPFLRKPPYDIIHCHFGWNGLKGMMLRDIGVLQGKLVTTFHGSDITSYVQNLGVHVYSQLFDRGDLFMPISNRWQQWLIELGCNEKKIIVHRMGIDCRQLSFTPRKLDANSPVRIATIARLVEKKGVEYGIRAVAKLAKVNRKIEYNVIGDGPLKEELQQLIQELNVSNVVKLLGWKQQQEVVEIINNTNILLTPSVTSQDGDREGIPVVLMEAMAMGLPVVATKHSGIPELVEDRVSGFLVSERDVDALAEKLGYLIEHPEVWTEMGLAGRRCVEECYDINKLNDQLVNFYRELTDVGMEHTYIYSNALL